jgi:hypothetical protein
MTRNRAGVRVVVLAWLLLASGALAEGQGELFTMPQGEDVFFFSDHGVGAEFLGLRQDGTYARFRREHMFVAEVDSGRWEQRADDGALWLCSNSVFEDLPFESPGIGLVGKVEFDALEAMVVSVAAFLKKRPQRQFLHDELKAIAAGPFAFALHGRSARPVTREDLERVVGMASRYARVANLSRGRVLSYGGQVFLIGLRPWDPSWAQVIAAVDANEGRTRATTRITAERSPLASGRPSPSGPSPG